MSIYLIYLYLRDRERGVGGKREGGGREKREKEITFRFGV